MICRLAAGLGQAAQASSGLTTTSVVEYIFHVCRRKIDEGKPPWMSDMELWFHVQAAGLVTLERRERVARDRQGRLRTEAEVEKSVVCTTP